VAVDSSNHQVEDVQHTDLSNPIQFRVNLIMGEATLEDIDGYEDNREGVDAKTLEAEQILQIQSDLGLNFAEVESKTISRLIDLDDRVRKELNKDEESRGVQ
jgi:hypothetical protein